MKAKSQTNSGGAGLKVICRFRPSNKKELESGQEECVQFIDSQTMKLLPSPVVPSVKSNFG